MNSETLIAQIVSEPDPDSPQIGVLANELLSNFHQGYSLEKLRPLLRSDNDRLVKTGVWIASELGEKGKALLSDATSLLKHPLKAVRFFAIDCVLLSASPAEQLELASVVPLLDGVETAVRWQAMNFLSRASREQLQAALSFLQAKEPASKHVQGLQWLRSTEASNPESIATALRSADSSLRKYAAVAASRISKSNTKPLFLASTLEDPDVKGFADSSIKLL